MSYDHYRNLMPLPYPNAAGSDAPACAAVALDLPPSGAAAEFIQSSDGGVENGPPLQQLARQDRVARELGSETIQHQGSSTGPSEPIVMVPRADLYGGRVLLTGAGYDPEAAAIAPVEAGEFDRPTTIAGWKSYFNDLAGKPPE